MGLISHLIIIAALLLIPAAGHGGQTEAHYRDAWCSENGGQTEVILSDRTRCDCLTNTHAIEFDFARKWAEAIGQSLHYANQTGRRAGIVLILENPSDEKYLIRINSIILNNNLPIDVWIIH